MGWVLLVLVIFLFVGPPYTVARPDQALVVTGVRGMRLVRNGCTVIIPFLERCHSLSLELFSVRVSKTYRTIRGVPIVVDALFHVRFDGDPVSLRTASEQLLSRSRMELEGLIRSLVSGFLRETIAGLTSRQVEHDHDLVLACLHAASAGHLNKLGLQIVTFVITEVHVGERPSIVAFDGGTRPRLMGDTPGDAA